MVITLPYINATNQHTVNLKLIQCHMSTITQKRKASEIIKIKKGLQFLPEQSDQYETFRRDYAAAGAAVSDAASSYLSAWRRWGWG